MTNDTTTSLFTVERDQLRSLIERQLVDRLTESEQVVTAIDPTDSAIRVTFEGTTTELFDMVITTTRSCLPGQHRMLSAQTVDTWEFVCYDTAAHPGILTEAWTENLAAFTVPLSQGRLIQLVSANETQPSAPLSPETLLHRFGNLVEGEPFDNLDQRDLRYRRIPAVVPRWLTSEGVALVGRDTHLSLPGDCVGTTLSIEDACVLADSLASRAGDIEAALASYANRRRRRGTDLLTSTVARSTPTDCPSERSALLKQLYTKRRLAFGRVVE